MYARRTAFERAVSVGLLAAYILAGCGLGYVFGFRHKAEVATEREKLYKAEISMLKADVAHALIESDVCRMRK